jgi:uncharacterized membrane protein
MGSKPEMQGKTYRILETITKIGACALFAISVATANWILMLIAFIVAISIFIFLRLKVKDIVEDERTNIIAQKAKRFSYDLGNFVMGVAGMVLVFTNRNDLSGTQARIGYTLFFSSFGMTIINEIAYYFYSRKLGAKEQKYN